MTELVCIQDFNYVDGNLVLPFHAGTTYEVETTLAESVLQKGHANFEGVLVAAGEQRVRLLGPFHIAHDTAGISSTGALLTALDAGTWLLSVSVIATEAWENLTDGFVLTVGLGVSAAFDMGYETADADALNLNQSNANIHLGYGDARNATVLFAPVGLVNAGGLWVGFFPNEPLNVTAGEADIYALIAEPV